MLGPATNPVEIQKVFALAERRDLERRDGVPAWHGERYAHRPLRLFVDLRRREYAPYIRVGFGDIIQHLRFLSLLEGLRVQAQAVCDRQLRRLLALIPGVVFAAPPAPYDIRTGSFDFHVSSLMLPHVLARARREHPYDTYVAAPHPFITVPPGHHEQQTGRLRVGVCWRGTLACDPPADVLYPMIGRSDSDFISLVPDWDFDRPGVLPMPPVADFRDTAVLIASLDLIVSADTAVAHLSGAMGKPTWLLLPRAADPRWSARRRDGRPLLYPTNMRMFQVTIGPTRLGQQLAEALDAFVARPRCD